MWLHLFNQNYSDNSNILKYFYNLKYLNAIYNKKNSFNTF